MVNFRQMAVAIVTHARPKSCLRLVSQVREAVPEHRAIYVIGNHPDDARTVGRVLELNGDSRTRFVGTGRPSGHHGNLAQSWNLAMLYAFQDPKVKWLWCLQDDMEVHPGWRDRIAQYDADLYVAPAGDMAFLFNRKVLREVGWFDERFAVIGYQEWDWQARAVLALGYFRVSIEDKHGWVFNAVGLSEYWKDVPRTPGNLLHRKNETHVNNNRKWFCQKWHVKSPNNIWSAVNIGSAPEPEIDWYPWFDRKVPRG